MDISKINGLEMSKSQTKARDFESKLILIKQLLYKTWKGEVEGFFFALHSNSRLSVRVCKQKMITKYS